MKGKHEGARAGAPIGRTPRSATPDASSDTAAGTRTWSPPTNVSNCLHVNNPSRAFPCTNATKIKQLLSSRTQCCTDLEVLTAVSTSPSRPAMQWKKYSCGRIPVKNRSATNPPARASVSHWPRSLRSQLRTSHAPQNKSKTRMARSKHKDKTETCRKAPRGRKGASCRWP